MDRYICQQCGGAMLTVVREEGDVPMMQKCLLRRPDGTRCMGSAKADLDFEPSKHDLPGFEFYRLPRERWDKVKPYPRWKAEQGQLILRRLAF